LTYTETLYHTRVGTEINIFLPGLPCLLSL